MVRLLLRLTLPLLISFSGLMMLIRAQSHDNPELRSFLLPEDCAKPCLMGIQPGVTSTSEAIQRLRTNARIAHVGISESLETVAWFWQPDQSPLMDTGQISALFYDRDRVSLIRLYTRIPLGELLLQLDALPGNSRVVFRRSPPFDRYHVSLYYAGDGYVVNAVVDCDDFWGSPAHLIIGARPQFINGLGQAADGLNEAKHLIATNCRNQQYS